MPELHFEPFVHLAGLDDDQALISWGGFWFRPFEDGHGWRVVEDEQLSEIDPGRTDSIGARSDPYGDALVEVFDADGMLVSSARTSDCNHVWVKGLAAATDYRYELTVDGEPWVPIECRSWHQLDDKRGELRPAGRTYDLRFRTFPDPAAEEPLAVAAIGDYGVGIQGHSDHSDHQLRLAKALERLAEARQIDLILTLGDNIYHAEDRNVGGTGSEDDDWYFSFYEPYRFLISRIPLYPTVGNHDAAESEDSDDRDQLADNHFTRHRFTPEVEADRASVRLEQATEGADAGDGTRYSDESGLFYRFSCGALGEFVCIDTSEAGALSANRFFDDPEHQHFLDESFDPERAERGRWLIPFAHHPPFCAGPKHHNDDEQLSSLVPRYRKAGVRLVLAGHEHNFQHSVVDDLHCVVSGAGAKRRPERPDGFEDAGTRAWSNEPHLLLLEIGPEEIVVHPFDDVDDAGELSYIDPTDARDEPTELPIVITR